MSSHLPVRRTLRATSRPLVINNKENATRAVRASTRAKPPSTVADAKAATLANRATGSTAATRAKSHVPVLSSKDEVAPQGKRKREALGEVARPPANVVRQDRDAGRATTTLKGKGKASSVPPAKEVFDGVEIKKPASTASRAPLKVVASASKTVTTTTTTLTRRTRSITAAADVKEEVHHHQRAPSHSQPAPSSHAVAGHSRLRERSQPTRLAQVKEVEEDRDEKPAVVVEDDIAMTVEHTVPAPRGLSVRRATAANTTVQARREGLQRAHAHARARSEIEKDEDEYHRAYKKQRTSSEVPEEPHVKVEHSSHLFLRGYDSKFEPEEEVVEEEEEEAVEREADPNGDEWDDLDAEDADDPLMVSEYVVDIFNYLKEVEQTTMPNPNYMEMQRDLAWKMRGILNDWLVQVHSRFRLLPETLFLAINIIDRFLSQRVVSLAKLQLVGITCMFLAAKVEEVVAPSAANFLYCADSSYTETEILQAERYVLKTLEWNVSYPNPIHFLRRVSKADEYNVQVRTIAKYLLEIQCLEWRLIAAPPSLLAAAAIWLARLILGLCDWTPNLAHYSSYAESELVPTANLMLNYVLKPLRHQSFHRKYAGKKFLKASIFVRDWATSRWEEGRPVALQEELPKLKAMIRAAREAEALQQQEYEEF